MVKIVGVLQARMGSERLPGKVLADLEGVPLLSRCLNRAGRARSLNELWVATSVLEEDRVVADLAESLGVPCFRGSSEDVLDRYFQAAQVSGAQVIVRLTGDNPLVDPEIVDQVVEAYCQGELDYACNRRPRTFPLGLDVEVFSADALEKAWREDHNPAWREHVTPYLIHHGLPERMLCLQNPIDYGHLRWTVDTEADLELCRRIYQHFGHDRFGWREALDVVESRPEWMSLNAQVVQRKVCDGKNFP